MTSGLLGDALIDPCAQRDQTRHVCDIGLAQSQ